MKLVGYYALDAWPFAAVVAAFQLVTLVRTELADWSKYTGNDNQRY